MSVPHPLGRIGQLAEDLRCAARLVTNDMRLTPGGDAYEYQGSTAAIAAVVAIAPTIIAQERERAAKVCEPTRIAVALYLGQELNMRELTDGELLFVQAALQWCAARIRAGAAP